MLLIYQSSFFDAWNNTKKRETSRLCCALKPEHKLNENLSAWEPGISKPLIMDLFGDTAAILDSIV